MNKRVKKEAAALLSDVNKADTGWIIRVGKLLKVIAKEPSDKPTPLELVFLRHAARETAWANAFAKEREYSGATKALARRDTWLNAALITSEHGQFPDSNVLPG